MKLSTESLNTLRAQCDVVPGNLYPAKGGKGADFWLVVATSDTGAHLLGFNAAGQVVSTASYLKSAMRERPVIGRCTNLAALQLEVLS